jgi:hypothetical protein
MLHSVIGLTVLLCKFTCEKHWMTAHLGFTTYSMLEIFIDLTIVAVLCLSLSRLSLCSSHLHLTSCHTHTHTHTSNGTIPNMTSTTPIAEQFPMGCQFSGAMSDAVTFKAFAFRGYLKEKRAGHRIHRKLRNSTCPYPARLYIDHYKWSWDVFDKLQRRITHYRTLPGVHWWTESVSFLDHIAANDGKIDISRPDLQCELLEYGHRSQSLHYIPYVDAKTIGVPMTDEYGNIQPTNCGQRPIKQCPSKIKRPNPQHQQQQLSSRRLSSSSSLLTSSSSSQRLKPNPTPAVSFVDVYEI